MERIRTFSMPSDASIRIPGGGAETTITERHGQIWLDMERRCIHFVPNQPEYRSRAISIPFEALKNFDMPAAILDELSPPPPKPIPAAEDFTEPEEPRVTSGRGRKARAA